MRAPLIPLLAALLLRGLPARAQEPPPEGPPADAREALATELFNAGRDLVAANRYAEACPKLVESVRLEARVGTLAKLAECEERIGQVVSARAHWQQAANLARAERDDRQARVEQEVARLDRIVPKLLFVLPKVRAADVEVRLDDAVLGPGMLELTMPVSPGQHRVIVSRGGRVAWSSVVTLAPDGAVTRVVVPEAAVATRTELPPRSLAEPQRAGATPLEVVGIVTIGLGVVALGAGAYAAGRTSAQREASDAGCDGDLCTPAGAALRNDARATGDVATALLIAGGGAALGGVLVFLLAPRAGGPPGPSVQGALVAGAHSATAALRGTW
jgi:hypothetical protein